MREHVWGLGAIQVAFAVCTVILFVTPGQGIVQGNAPHAVPWTSVPSSEPSNGEQESSSLNYVVSPTFGVDRVNGTLCLLSNTLWPGNDPAACNNGVEPVSLSFRTEGVR